MTLIAFEGIDGAGKTTLIREVGKDLKYQEALEVKFLKEPDDSHWTGSVVRQALEKDTHPVTDTLLFAADHAEHVKNKVVPNLRSFDVVLQDRSPVSMYAYQPVTLQSVMDSPEQWIENIYSDWVKIPDVVIYLDIDVSVAFDRINSSDKYEKGLFLKEVLGNYRQMPDSLPYDMEWYTIDGSEDVDTVRTMILKVLEDNDHI